IIANNEPSRARPLLLSWLGDDARTEDAERAKHAAQLLLQRDPAAAWPTVYQLLLDEPEFGKEVILATAANHRNGWPDLQPQQLADLYLWLTQHFPRTQDPQIEGAHVVGPREEVAHWRDSIPQTLGHAGTPEAVAAVRRIAEDSAAEPWLMLSV